MKSPAAVRNIGGCVDLLDQLAGRAGVGQVPITASPTLAVLRLDITGLHEALLIA